MRTLAFLALALLACAAPHPNPTRGIPRAAGCDVAVVREGVPEHPTRLQGQIVARCTNGMADEAHCLRQLQDEACRLGAVVIWDVRSQPLELTEGIEMRAAAGTYR